jgi:hypothetical protein
MCVCRLLAAGQAMRPPHAAPAAPRAAGEGLEEEEQEVAAAAEGEPAPQQEPAALVAVRRGMALLSMMAAHSGALLSKVDVLLQVGWRGWLGGARGSHLCAAAGCAHLLALPGPAVPPRCRRGACAAMQPNEPGAAPAPAPALPKTCPHATHRTPETSTPTTTTTTTTTPAGRLLARAERRVGGAPHVRRAGGHGGPPQGRAAAGGLFAQRAPAAVQGGAQRGPAAGQLVRSWQRWRPLLPGCCALQSSPGLRAGR